MSEFTDQQIPIIARRVLAERDAGRQVDPERIKWAEGALEDEKQRLSTDPRFGQWAARSEA